MQYNFLKNGVIYKKYWMRMDILKVISKFKLFREIYAVIFLLLFLTFTPFILSGCGGGGGKSSASSNTTPTTTFTAAPLPTIPITPLITPLPLPSGSPINTMNVYLDKYSDENAVNKPYVNVYINGSPTPIPLLLDTGATGIMINQSALTNAGITVSQSGYTFSGSFGDGGTFSGQVDYANVSTAAGGSGLTAQNIPIAVAAADMDFPSGGFLQGDFGMGLSPYPYLSSFGNSNGSMYTPSIVTAFPAPYNNGFILDFNNVSFIDGGFDIINEPDITPAGTLIFGLNTESNNMIPAGSNFFPNASGQTYAFPMIESEFGGYFSTEGKQFYSFFDTGTNYIHLGTDAINYGTGNSLAYVDDVYSCEGFSFLYGGTTIDFGLFINSNFYHPYGLETAPDNTYNDFCDYTALTNAMNSSTASAIALDNNVLYDTSFGSEADFGLALMLNQPFYWQAQSSNSSWGVGIEPQN
jgi:hypothetical protein